MIIRCIFLMGFVLVAIHAKTQVISPLIIIDPGHNYGDIASGNRTETEVYTNWEVANKLKVFINNDINNDYEAHLICGKLEAG